MPTATYKIRKASFDLPKAVVTLILLSPCDNFLIKRGNKWYAICYHVEDYHLLYIQIKPTVY